MADLFVDVDGTLIDENDKPFEAVVSAVELVAPQFTRVIIWSGGGADYARLWRDRLFPGRRFDATAKDSFRTLPSDAMAVDDLAEEMAGYLITATLLTPEEFVMWALAGGAHG